MQQPYSGVKDQCQAQVSGSGAGNCVMYVQYVKVKGEDVYAGL